MDPLTSLPESVRTRVEFSPVEDIFLTILRSAFPDMHIVSLIPEDLGAVADFPFVVVRRASTGGEWRGDPRFIDHARLAVQVFAKDPDGDSKAALVSEAIRSALHEAWRSHVNVPGRGTILQITMDSEPEGVTDWATAVGPVQYADLPAGVHRYEAEFLVSVRKEPGT